MAKLAQRIIYQIKVTLELIRPPVWRRLLVPSTVSLAHLHEILQIAMGWLDCHLHMFEGRGQTYGVPDPESAANVRNEARVRLDQVLLEPKDAMFYEYDFGDGWRHKVVLEKVLEPSSGTRYPRCIAGARACPPEDCGGPWGYANLLEIIANPSHPEHEEMREWVGDYFDPAHFDLDEINEVLSPRKGRVQKR
jgi:hypothetical protein